MDNHTHGDKWSYYLFCSSTLITWLSAITPEAWIKALSIISLLLTIAYHIPGVVMRWRRLLSKTDNGRDDVTNNSK